MPPTINLDHPSVETKIDLVPHVKREKRVDVALSNSFGFGGQNTCLVLSAAPGGSAPARPPEGTN